ncbi:MAG: hypothetical protein KGL39_26085 [Patescibacteria group bacterium]|nr:hypothetical protein [Patescibacteria group bacterium]
MPAEMERKARKRGIRRFRAIRRGGHLLTCAIVGRKGPRGGATVCWPRHVKHALA